VIKRGDYGRTIGGFWSGGISSHRRRVVNARLRSAGGFRAARADQDAARKLYEIARPAASAQASSA